MRGEHSVVSFEVVERADVELGEIERLARRQWHAMTAEHDRVGESPRWICCGPVDPGSAYTAHRFEGLIRSSQDDADGRT